MAGRVLAKQPSTSFEYEFLESDPELLRTILSSPNQLSSWIEPSTLKLRHRIGRGPFGDVWLATHHQSNEDFDGSHEVAVKMLHAVREDHMKALLDKFVDLFSRCQGLDGVCFLHGISVKNGKICIVMKFYEGSVGDRMGRLKGGKLSLPDVLRYGITLAEGILGLHSKGIFVLNLKPSNFLLTENDKAIVGDVGIPYTLLGISSPSPDAARRLGTPNYMAPEQWKPEVRGPISFETDSWGFGCSIVEMLTGAPPWAGKSVDEIYRSVVMMQEKPCIMATLPPAFENLILGCFLYDFRSRPLMSNILHALRSLQIAVGDGESWASLGTLNNITDTSSNTAQSDWSFMKDHLQVGDTVRSRKKLQNSSKHETMDVPEGSVAGLDRDNERDGSVLVRIHGIHDPVRVHASALERVTHGLSAGDWVCLKERDTSHAHSPVGILHSIDRDGNVLVGFIGLESHWTGKSSDLQMAEPYCAGQFVKLKPNVLSPRFEWPCKRGGSWATGRVERVLPNGCLLIRFPGMVAMPGSFLADPAEVKAVSFGTCPGLVKKYEHLEDFHWAVRPVLIALSLFMVVRLGFVVGRSRAKKGHNIGGEGQHSETLPGSNTAWFRPSVANILFKEGVSAAPAW